MSRRAWSRAGAVADVLAAGVPRRLLGLTTRVSLLLLGSVAIASAVALMLWNDLGPGPLDVFIGAIRHRTGLPLSLAVWLTVGALTAVAWVLGRRPGAGTLLAPFVVGPTMQGMLELLGRAEPPSELAARVVVQLVAIAIAGLGAGSLIASGLGAGTGELLAAAASDRSGRPEPRVRMAFEATWLVVGVALGGPIGIGTLMVAFLIGPAVARGHRAVDQWVARSRRHLGPVVTAAAS
jgi:uncharacterized membrane protein YczE